MRETCEEVGLPSDVMTLIAPLQVGNVFASLLHIDKPDNGNDCSMQVNYGNRPGRINIS